MCCHLNSQLQTDHYCIAMFLLIFNLTLEQLRNVGVVENVYPWGKKLWVLTYQT